MDIAWDYWETLIERNGISVDRPRGTAHPCYPDMVYPLDYGYVQNTLGSDGEEVDIFVGTDASRLVAVLLTHDEEKGNDELKLLWNVTAQEVAIVHQFLNRGGMSAAVVWREST